MRPLFKKLFRDRLEPLFLESVVIFSDQDLRPPAEEEGG